MLETFATWQIVEHKAVFTCTSNNSIYFFIFTQKKIFYNINWNNFKINLYYMLLHATHLNLVSLYIFQRFSASSGNAIASYCKWHKSQFCAASIAFSASCAPLYKSAFLLKKYTHDHQRRVCLVCLCVCSLVEECNLFKVDIYL